MHRLNFLLWLGRDLAPGLMCRNLGPQRGGMEVVQVQELGPGGKEQGMAAPPSPAASCCPRRRGLLCCGSTVLRVGGYTARPPRTQPFCMWPGPLWSLCQAVAQPLAPCQEITTVLGGSGPQNHESGKSLLCTVSGIGCCVIAALRGPSAWPGPPSEHSSASRGGRQ